MMPDAQPVFTDTRWEFPALYEHLSLFEIRTGRRVEHLGREQSLPEYILERHFLPGHQARFCTRRFKIEVLDEWLAGRAPCELLIGLRADEPERVGNLSNIPDVTVRYPLREMGWTRLDVVAKCLSEGLLPRYPAYMARGGCVGCFYKRRSEVMAMIEMVPDVVDGLQVLEEAVQDERERPVLMFPNTGKTIRQLRAQPRLFSTADLYRDAGDKSDMGAECGLMCNR